MKRVSLVFAMLVAVGFGLSASADVLNDTFDTLSSDWQVDRYDPDVFEVAEFDGDSRLHVQTGTERSTNSWYWYEGRKLDPVSGIDVPWYVSIDLYVGALETSKDWEATLWTRDNNPVENSSNYPILGATTRYASGSDRLNGGPLHWTVWDSQLGWYDALPAITDFDRWYNLRIESHGDQFQFYIDNALVHTDVTGSTPGFADLQAIFIQARDFGPTNVSDVYWDNLSAGELAPVPEPATMTLLGLGLAGMAARRLRKRG